MDISPAVDTPRKGDPITAEWAAQVAAAANAVPHTPEEPGAFSSPFGSVPRPVAQPMLGDGDRPLPFDVRVWNDSGTDKIFVFLPSVGNLVTMGYVAVDSNYIPYGGAEALGANGWTDFGAASAGTAYNVGLAFTGQSGTYLHKWGVFVSSSTFSRPAWADAGMPLVLLARVEIQSGMTPSTPSDTIRYGVTQFHRGALWLSRNFVRWNIGSGAPNFWFRDNAGNKMFSTSDNGSGYLMEGDWSAQKIDISNLYFGGSQVSAQTVNIGGTNYTVLTI